MNPPPRLAAFFERKRRLAYYFAWTSMIALMLQSWLGYLLEFYSHPRAAVAGDGGYRVVHLSSNQDDPERSALIQLDADAKPTAGALSLPDPATAILAEDRDATVFFGSHATQFADGKISRSLDLQQKWDVLAAVADPAGPWVFGWIEDHVVARRRGKDGWGEEMVVLKTNAVERLVASREGSAGPIVAWREANTGKIHSARFDGAAFAAGPDFDIGAAEHWDAVATGGRLLLIVYNRDDRSFRYVTLRLECCPGCPSPIAMKKVALTEPVLLVGRKVTGLSALVAAGRLRFFITRMSTLMTATLPLEKLEPESSGSKLTSIVAQAPWRHVAGAFVPTLLAFCSFAMIFLGTTLFRIRSRIARGEPEPGPRSSDFFLRVMAYVLDAILLGPFIYFIIELASIGVDDGLPEPENPRFFLVVSIAMAARFVYYVLMEWRFGWTVGKSILGMKVTEADGSRLTFKGALLRNLVRPIDTDLLPILGAGFILGTRRRQRLGDLAARTVVVEDLPQ